MAAEVLQLEPIVIQDLADSFAESTSVGAVESISTLTTTFGPERNVSIPSKPTFCPTNFEPETASVSQFNKQSISKNLANIQNFIWMSNKLTVVKKSYGRKNCTQRF